MQKCKTSTKKSMPASDEAKHILSLIFPLLRLLHMQLVSMFYHDTFHYNEPLSRANRSRFHLKSFLSTGSLLIVPLYFHPSETLPPQSLDLCVEPQQRLSQLQVLWTHLQLHDNNEKNWISTLEDAEAQGYIAALTNWRVANCRKKKHEMSGLSVNSPAQTSARLSLHLSAPSAAPRWLGNSCRGWLVWQWSQTPEDPLWTLLSPWRRESVCF